MIHAHEGHTSLVVGGSILYVISGEGTKNCESYSLQTERWTPMPNIKKARDGAAATNVGDSIYVTGGKGVDKIERYSIQ